MLTKKVRSSIKNVLGLAVILPLLAGCFSPAAEKPESPPTEADLAEETLRGFFQALHAGEYDMADGLYGDSYETLIYFNPDLDPAEHTALWERLCTVNGFQCLEMGQLISLERTDESTFTLTVQFLTDEGDVFVLGPCCGADETTMPPVSEFPIRIALDDNGEFKVLDLPPFVP